MDLIHSGGARLLCCPGGGGCLLATAEGTELLRGAVCAACGAWWERATACWPGSSSAWPGVWRLRAAVRYGMAAGAAATLNPGTQLCSREDTERLFEMTP